MKESPVVRNQDPMKKQGPPKGFVANRDKPGSKSDFHASNWAIRGGKHIYNGVQLPDDVQLVAETFVEGPTADRGVGDGVLRARPAFAGTSAHPGDQKVVANWLDTPVEGNSAFLEGRPSFTWAGDDATTRAARLFKIGEDGNKIELPDALVLKQGTKARAPLTATLAAPISIESGAEYVLETVATTTEQIAGSNVESSKTTEWRFRVLNLRQRKQYGWARSNEVRLPVVAALLYYHLGEYGDAERVCGWIDTHWQATAESGDSVKDQSVEQGSTWRKWRIAIRRAYERRVSQPSES
jgi:hypothetical protein